MAHDDVEEYLERSKSLIDSAPQMGEENTKVKLIQPLIELLGWDVYSSEVELEYSIQIGQGQARADYALLIDGAPVVFIEAKGCDTTLSNTNRSQLKNYIRQKGADWGLLTNGQQFEILKRKENSDVPDEVLLASFSIEELQANWNVLELLSKELVRSGEAVIRADRIRAKKRATSELQREKDEIADEVAQLIVHKVGDTLIQEIEAESKEFIDELIDAFGADDDLAGPVGRPNPPNPVAKEYVVTLFNGDNQVELLNGEKQADVMASAVEQLVETHGLLDEIGSLPYVPGKKKAILHSKPEHPTGEEMSLYRTISNGCHLYVFLNKESKIRYIDRFAEMCGLTAEFDGGW